VTKSAKLASGFDVIYSLIANKPFRSSVPVSTADSVTNKHIATTGRVFSETNLPDIAQLDSWTIENESILGARLLRENKGGERIGNNELIALRTSEANAFMLGTISWRSVTRSGQLQMGVQYLPGVAQAIIIKCTDAGSASGKSIPALLLPAMPTLKIPGSLIVPRDVFQANRACELVHPNNEKFDIKMGFSVSAGIDSERVSYTQK
jgi:hypothetical protein